MYKRKYQSNETLMQKVKRLAHGQWDYVFKSLAPQLSDAMANAPHHVGLEGSDDFRLFRDWKLTGGSVSNRVGTLSDGIDTLAYVAEMTKGEALKAIFKLLKDDKITPIKLKKKTKTEKQKEARSVEFKKQMLNNAIAQSTPVSSLNSDSIAHKYLASRGINPWLISQLGEDIRFHANLQYQANNERTQYLPAIISVIRDAEGNIVSAHRTYLKKDGSKANVKEAKKLFPAIPGQSTMGGAVRTMQPINGVIGVAEGLETALAAMSRTGMPVWSTNSAVFLEGFIVPSDVTKVIIWADLDASGRGLEAAQTLAFKLAKQGVEFEIQMPNFILNGAKSVDWNDVHVHFPQYTFPYQHAA